MPFPWATGNFAILNFRMFLFIDRLKKVVCFLSDGGSAARRCHGAPCFAQPTQRSQRRRTLRNVRNGACQRAWRQQGMRDAGLARIGIFCKNMRFPCAGRTFCRRIKKKTCENSESRKCLWPMEKAWFLRFLSHRAHIDLHESRRTFYDLFLCFVFIQRLSFLFFMTPKEILATPIFLQSIGSGIS